MKDFRLGEKFYSVADIAALTSMSQKWVRARVKDGSFVDANFKPAYEGQQDLNVLDLGGEMRIAASAYNRFLASRVRVGVNPIRARTMGELKRKLRAHKETAHVSPPSDDAPPLDWVERREPGM